MQRRRYESCSRSPSYDRRRRRDRGRYRSDSRRGSRRQSHGRNNAVERFIHENELGDSVASRLRDASQQVQERVMDQGWDVLNNARNADAVVTSRIRKHQDAVEGGRSCSPARGRPHGKGGGKEVTFKEGDWYCRSCDGHNFARRTECFKCNAPRDERDERDCQRDSRSRSRSRGRS
mmetsp:Transcript_3195/g.6280  ORF Transcript_3195/g.6280 Transcript_3195/m.6280 type:complete len:177 (-) Transcript_3195:98-628(-)